MGDRLEDKGGEEAVEGAVERVGKACVGWRCLYRRRADRGEPSEAFVGFEARYGRLLVLAVGNGDYAVNLAVKHRNGVFGIEEADFVLIDNKLGFNPFLTLTHHNEADVDEFAALNVRHESKNRVFVKMLRLIG